MKIDFLKKPSAHQWYRLYLVGYGLFYIWVLYRVVEMQRHFLDCKDCMGDIQQWGGIVNALFLTLTFAFYLQNKRWGWILTAVSSISTIMTGLVGLQVLYKYRQVMSPTVAGIFIDNVVPVLMVIVLWRPGITSFFGISKRDRRRTFWAGIGVGLLYVLVLELTTF